MNIKQGTTSALIAAAAAVGGYTASPDAQLTFDGRHAILDTTNPDYANVIQAESSLFGMTKGSTNYTQLQSGDYALIEYYFDVNSPAIVSAGNSDVILPEWEIIVNQNTQSGAVTGSGA